ncbi:MAG TPA: LysR substrate-binding domain-containing protein [Ideonella sp.]|nr:LysR substrate-binding domain-containing protein [Ideonella sp.]
MQRRHIDALVAVGDSRSVHRAARELGLAQPALSRLLSEAEALVGAQLFERSSQGSRPTAQGETVLARARALQRGLARLGEALQRPADVRLGCIPRVMHTLVPGVLESVAADEHASFAVRLVEASSGGLLAAAANGELDFAILILGPASSDASDAGDASQALTFEPLYDERTVIICAAGHAAIPDGVVPLSLLARQAWVLPAPDTASRAAFDMFCSEHRLGRVQTVTEARSFETNLALVTHTRFLSIAPESIARRHAAFGAVRIVRTRHALPASPITLAYRATLQGDPVLDGFCRLVHSVAAQVRADLKAPARSKARPAA